MFLWFCSTRLMSHRINLAIYANKIESTILRQLIHFFCFWSIFSFLFIWFILLKSIISKRIYALIKDIMMVFLQNNQFQLFSYVFWINLSKSMPQYMNVKFALCIFFSKTCTVLDCDSHKQYITFKFSEGNRSKYFILKQIWLTNYFEHTLKDRSSIRLLSKCRSLKRECVFTDVEIHVAQQCGPSRLVNVCSLGTCPQITVWKSIKLHLNVKQVLPRLF